jgi:hypothetical protein
VTGLARFSPRPLGAHRLRRRRRPQVGGSLERLGLESVELIVFDAISALDDYDRLMAPGEARARLSCKKPAARAGSG